MAALTAIWCLWHLQQRLADSAAADRLAKLQDDVRVMRDLWDSATSARTSAAALERGDFAAAAGALHASISLGCSGGPTSSQRAPWEQHGQSFASSIGVDEGAGSHALGTGVVPWLLFDPFFFGRKNSCSHYFRSIGKSASDPSRPISSYVFDQCGCYSLPYANCLCV